MDDKVIKKSLRYSLIDGIFASVMTGASETFITPYALAMKASASLIGILASMPSLVGALLQMKAAEIVERLGSRKALINSSVLYHALMWIPIISIPYLIPASGKLGNPVIYLIIFYTLLISIGVLSFPPWSSLMADYVPQARRGKVFAFRNKVFGIINVTSMFLAGLTLYLFKRFPIDNFKFFGFTVIFSIAFVSRLISWHFLKKMYEAPVIVRDKDRFTLLDFLKRMRQSNFGRFVFFVSSMHFAVNIAGPFFAVYMLRDLKFNYLTYTLIVMTATLTTLFMMKAWGAHADEVGNVKVLRLTSYLVPFIPMLWLFSSNPLYLASIQIYAGFLWAGFNLSASNFIYDAVTPEKRTRCIAYFNVINGVSVFSGAALGAYLVRVVPPLLGNRILCVFLISGALRIFAAFFSSSIKEVRPVKDISSLELFYSVIARRPLLTSISSGKE